MPQERIFGKLIHFGFIDDRACMFRITGGLFFVHGYYTSNVDDTTIHEEYSCSWTRSIYGLNKYSLMIR